MCSKARGVEERECHHVFRHKFLLTVSKVSLAVCFGGVFFTLLQHGTRLHTGNADGTVDAGDDHDKPFAYQFVAGGGKSKHLFQYFTTIIGGIQSLNCHCLFKY